MKHVASAVAVLISDIHYNINTLALADAALNQAIKYAEEHKLPLVIAGDLHDTKAHMRAECVSAMINTLKDRATRIMVIPGNHCMVSEKSNAHSLGFLSPYVEIVDSPRYDEALGVYLIPYQTSCDTLRAILNDIPKGSRIIMHQGVQTAYLGHYVQDKTSLPQEAFADFRVISGHYHRAQDIKCSRPRKGAVGLFSYIGSPYSLSFGEANDGPKGFQVLHDDGLMEQVKTNLRRHRVIEWDVRRPFDFGPYPANDLIWVKAHGPASELAKVDKKALGEVILGHSNFKLDLIKDTEQTLEVSEKPRTDDETLDALIDNTSETPEQKTILKALWREVLDETA